MNFARASYTKTGLSISQKGYLPDWILGQLFRFQSAANQADGSIVVTLIHDRSGTSWVKQNHDSRRLTVKGKLDAQMFNAVMLDRIEIMERETEHDPVVLRLQIPAQRPNYVAITRAKRTKPAPAPAPRTDANHAVDLSRVPLRDLVDEFNRRADTYGDDMAMFTENKRLKIMITYGG